MSTFADRNSIEGLPRMVRRDSVFELMAMAIFYCRQIAWVGLWRLSYLVAVDAAPLGLVAVVGCTLTGARIG